MGESLGGGGPWTRGPPQCLGYEALGLLTTVSFKNSRELH